jgi:N6-adenosine-specific RNA methylase IME4
MDALVGLFSCIVADPPWPIRWSGGAAWRTNGRGERHLNKRFKKALDYPTMPVADICALNVGRLAAPDSVLWLWVTDRFALEGAGAAVARAWGFEPIRYLVWQKTGIGMGHCPRASHELCMVCRRGRNIWQRRDVPSVQRWGLVYENGARKHSAKPPAFFDLASTCTPGPYLELFARERRLGWEAWGNEVNSTVTVEANGNIKHDG